jgi:hypothetical protein
MTKDEALKMAIEALEQYIGVVQHKVNAETWGDIEDGGKPAIKALQACKEALEQQTQEPVGWMDSEGRFRLDFKTEIVRSIAAVNKEIPLYTHPAPSWQGLSDDEIKIIQDNSWIIHSSEHKEFNTFKFARAIEQALKDKNT